MNNRILLVDDDPGVLSSLKRALHKEPLDISVALSAEEALTILKTQHFKVIVSDERMPGMHGVEFLAKVREYYANTQRIMLTAYADTTVAIKAINENEVFRFLTKPWDDQQLILTVRAALEKYDLETEKSDLLERDKQQLNDFRVLETQYPGITRVEKDREGACILPDLAEDDVERALSELEYTADFDEPAATAKK